MNDYDCLQLSKLDVLSSFEKIKIAIAYKDPETGKELTSFPADQSVLERVEVVYHELPGWNSSIAKVREWSELPKEARDYVEYIENFVQMKVSYSPSLPKKMSAPSGWIAEIPSVTTFLTIGRLNGSAPALTGRIWSTVRSREFMRQIP